MIAKTIRIAGLSVFACIALSSAAWAGTCSNASLSGTYGFQHSGTAGDGTPIAGLSQLTFDPTTGTYTGVDTQSHDGVLTTSPLTADYSVAPNCTVIATVTLGGNSQEIDFVVTSRGFLSLVERAGVTTEGIAFKQGAPTCTNAGIAGGFAFQTTGVFLPGAPATGPVDFIGELNLAAGNSGAGEISGRMAGSENGTLLAFADEPVSGSYKIDADCTGKATIKLKGVPDMHFILVVVNSGKKLLVIETDANTVVSGSLLKNDEIAATEASARDASPSNGQDLKRDARGEASPNLAILPVQPDALQGHHGQGY